MAKSSASAEPAEIEDVVEDVVVGEDQLDVEGQEIVDDSEGQDQDAQDIEYEIDIPNEDGTFDTETVRLNEIPDILVAARKIREIENGLVERERELNQSRDLLQFIQQDNFTRMVTSYRLEGRSELEVAEAIYNFYNQNAEQEPEEVDPRYKALQEKIDRYEKHVETQEMQYARNENNSVISRTFVDMGFDAEKLSDPRILQVANDVAARVFREIASDVDPNLFTAKRKVSPMIAKLIWQEVAQTVGEGKLKAGTHVAKKPLAIRVKSLQTQASSNKSTTARPPRLVGANRGVDPSGGKTNVVQKPHSNRTATAKDRKSALDALLHGK